MVDVPPPARVQDVQVVGRPTIDNRLIQRVRHSRQRFLVPLGAFEQFGPRFVGHLEQNLQRWHIGPHRSQGLGER